MLLQDTSSVNVWQGADITSAGGHDAKRLTHASVACSGVDRNALRTDATPEGDVLAEFALQMRQIHAFGLHRFEDVDRRLRSDPGSAA